MLVHAQLFKTLRGVDDTAARDKVSWKPRCNFSVLLSLVIEMAACAAPELNKNLSWPT